MDAKNAMLCFSQNFELTHWVTFREHSNEYK